MRCVLHVFTAACLLGAFAAPAAHADTIASNADICASTDDSAFPPQRRISACSALIETLSDQPQALAAALVNRGAAHWSISETAVAVTDLDRAIALDPKNARAFRERSNAYRTLNRYDRAIADANEAIRLDPNDPKAFDARGNAFNLNGQNDRAIDDYNEALRLKPNNSISYMDLGAAYYFKKDYQTAIKKILTRPSSLIRRIRAPSPIAAQPMRNSAASIRPLPMTARRSNSIRSIRNISIIAA